MAHQLTDRDGFFTVRQPAWHGLGMVLDDYPTREEAQQIAHPWEPVAEPVYKRRLVVDDDGTLVEKYIEIEHSVLQSRSDDDFELGVTSDTYESVKNGEMYDIAEVIEGEDGRGDVKFETGGSLEGGKKVWLLLRMKDPIVVPGDPHGATIPYYALQNDHRAAGSFRGQATVTRIVCGNTAQVADMDAKARGTEFNFRHTKNVRQRIEEAKMALAGWREGIQRWRLVSEALMEIKISKDQAVLFTEQFFPMPPPHAISPRVEHNVNHAREQLTEILYGETCEGIAGNAYGLVQASVEYLNWARRANSNESRFKRAFLDRNVIVSDAQELALAVAKS